MYEKGVCTRLIELDLLQEDFLRQLPKYPNFLDGVLSWGVTYEALTDVLLKDYGISSRRIQAGDISDEFINSLHPLMERLVKKHSVLPVSLSENRLFLLMANPFDCVAADDAKLLTGHDIECVFAEPQAIRRCIEDLYRTEDTVRSPARTAASGLPNVADAQSSPIVRLLDDIIETAIRSGASDIHIEPFGSALRVRHRIDGSLTLYKEFDLSLHQGLMVRLKVISGLDTSEKRVPQDGHIISGVYSDKVDFRVSTIPTVFGEKAVIRLIYVQHSKVDKDSLGFFPEDMPDLDRMFDRSPGAVIVTGPTGSGKTTTLAAFLNELNSIDVNAVSIEDPVENNIYGVNQININPKTGMDFANSLRSVLRQDPDIIMLGEIRDPETANVAMRAALTGHLLLTTLHTNDAVGSIVRLTDMGVPAYIVSSALKGVISQRLMRRLCPECKRRERPSAEYARVPGLPPDAVVFAAEGCSRCNFTGYSGRFAVYEYILTDAGLRELIHDNADAGQITRRLKEQGMRPIWDNALRNVLMGNTSVSEMYRTVFTAAND